MTAGCDADSWCLLAAKPTGRAPRKASASKQPMDVSKLSAEERAELLAMLQAHGEAEADEGDE